MSKHTPGPWVTNTYYDDFVTVTDKDGFEHATAESTAILFGYDKKLGIKHWADRPDAYREISIEEQAANARLIAAAPELLRALQAVVNDCHDLDMVPSNERGRTTTAFELAVAAIAKATGEA